VPDVDDIAALTAEHANEMIVLLCDCLNVQEAMRNGCDPVTGRIPRTPEKRQTLLDRLAKEEQRLTRAYSDAVAAFAECFGDDAAQSLDEWTRKTVADGGPSRMPYSPTHPWHYFHAGDNAAPVPVEEIPADDDAGRFLDAGLPKNPAKRLAKLRDLLEREREQLDADQRRYAEVVERGAEALSRYDREIAHSSDAMARATALALKYRHVSLGLGRVAWIESELRRLGVDELFADRQATSAIK
jgi:hypothetical protein